MLSKRKAIALATAGSLGVVSVSTSQATMIAYEPFGYAYPGNVTSGTDTGAVGLSGNWESFGGSSSVQSGSLSDSSATTTSNGNSLAENQATLVQTLAASALYPSDTSPGHLFVSFLIDLGVKSGSGAAEFQFYGSGGDSTASNVGFNAAKSSTDWGFRPNSAAAFTYASVSDANGTVTANVTTLLVMELDYNGAGTDTAELYVNPTSTSAAYDVNATGLSLGTALDGIELYDSNGQDYFDEIRIGTTFADVIGAPEPASMGLLGAVGAAALLRRRQRK